MVKHNQRYPDQPHRLTGLRPQSYDIHLRIDYWFVVLPVKMVNYALFFLLASLIFSPYVAVMGQDWLGFHGLGRQGVGHEPAATMIWSDQIETVWKTPIKGFGFSSPVVVGESVYLTTAYETPKGAGLRTVIGCLNLVLAWGLLVIATIIMIRAAANNWSGQLVLFNGARLVLLMAVALLVLATCLFAPGLYNLDNSLVRSWKIGTAVSALSLFVALILAPRQIRPAVLFAVAATLLSVFAYLLMPRQELSLNVTTSKGMVSAMVVLAPAVVAWAVCLTWLLARRTFPQPENSVPQASMRSRLIRTAVCFALSALSTVGVLWLLLRRLLDTSRSLNWNAADETEVIVRFEPTFGWPFFTGTVLLSVVAVVIGCLFLFRWPSFRRPLVVCGECVALFLGLTCFLWFVVFPSKRQIAYAVVCLDKKTGTIQWLREIGYSDTLHDYKGENSHATPTVAVGADGLCAYFGSGGLVGLDPAGNVRWKVQNAEFDSPFGVGHSPVVDQNMVILANDNESYQEVQKTLESHIYAFDLKHGTECWRQKRNRSQPGAAGFSTPIIRTIYGRKTVLMRGWEDLTAYDLQTGGLLWSCRLKHSGNFLVAGVVTDDKRAYVLDGVGVKALKLDALADGREAIVWRAQVPGEKVSTPVLVDGLLFLATDTGVAFCIDALTGKVEWRQKLGGRFFSSAVAHGDYVYFINENGDFSVVARSRTFKMLIQKNLGEKIYASPVPQADGLLIRAGTNLCFLKPEQISDTSRAQELESSPVMGQGL